MDEDQTFIHHLNLNSFLAMERKVFGMLSVRSQDFMHGKRGVGKAASTMNGVELRKWGIYSDIVDCVQ